MLPLPPFWEFATVTPPDGVVPVEVAHTRPTVAATPDWLKMPISRTSGMRTVEDRAAGWIAAIMPAAAPVVLVTPASRMFPATG